MLKEYIMHKLGYIFVAFWFFFLLGMGLSIVSACNEIKKNNNNLFIALGGE